MYFSLSRNDYCPPTLLRQNA